MSLYHLERIEEAGWDEAIEMVVRARSAQVARKIASEYAGDEGAATWLNVELTTCRELKVDGAEGLIVRDFKNG